VLRGAGAVLTPAHPGEGGKKASAEQRQRLEWWLDRHLDGLEVYTRKHTPEYESLALEVVRSRNAPYSGGSDSHSYGEAEGGDGEGVSTAPYDCLRSLKEFKAAHR